MSRNSQYSEARPVKSTIDWVIVACYLALVIFGWLNIYASVHANESLSLLDVSSRSGKQFIWILTSVALAGIILFAVPAKVHEIIAPFAYCSVLLLLLAVIFIGGEVKGSHSWFVLGPVSFQPAEISKLTTSLMLASYMSRHSFKMRGRSLWMSLGLIALPMLFIILEKETGSALVYLGYMLMFYRQGLSGWTISAVGLSVLLFTVTITTAPYIGIMVLLGIVTVFDSVQTNRMLWWLIAVSCALLLVFITPNDYKIVSACVLSAVYLGYSSWKAFRINSQKFRWATITILVAGIILVFSAHFIFTDVLKPHQRSRIEVLLGMKEDLRGVGYNVYQSKIAIGSGGLTGKGFCSGTQTAYGFVPEQSTDFIFCTVGEEWGFVGCLAVILVYCCLIFRIILDSERCRMQFTRIYGYCVAGCLAMHMFINVGMTVGLMPVIGIPLPFMSYGGSSMWGFTIMLFIFVSLYRNERKYF